MTQETIDVLWDIIKDINDTSKRLEAMFKNATPERKQEVSMYVAGRQSVISLIEMYIPTVVEDSWMDEDNWAKK